jgi:predicted membrane protein
MSNLTFQFKSNLNIFFYFGIAFILLILAFTGYNLLRQKLTIGSFLFLNAIALIISYVFALRFSCSVILTGKTLKINYYFKDEKQLCIPPEEIVSFDKHTDAVHRYFKKLLIVTPKETFFIRYNISDNSDEDMLKLLNMIVEENKLRLT